jgi:hypothetical protein
LDTWKRISLDVGKRGVKRHGRNGVTSTWSDHHMWWTWKLCSFLMTCNIGLRSYEAKTWFLDTYMYIYILLHNILVYWLVSYPPHYMILSIL